MAISNERKMAIATRFVTGARPYINRGHLIDAHLCEFRGGCLSFKFSERGEASPGLGIYVNGRRKAWLHEFDRCCPPGFVANHGQQHRGNEQNGWISFCKDGYASQDAVYRDIVEDDRSLEVWRQLFNALKRRLEELIGEVQIHGAVNAGNQDLPVEVNVVEPVNVDDGENDEEDEMNDDRPEKYNLIIFGAPGTGKSYKLEDERKKDEDFRTNYERVTFYPTYSYAQFVGTYKPVMNGDKIAYRFVPGPFLRLLVKASAAPEKKFLLLIEEINRANAAAVFGDVFQLLDRKDGISEYPIAASEDIKDFLVAELKKRNLTSGFGMTNENGGWTGDCVLSLPNNFYIWATMNSADQGVFPLDTAFKRRWDFEYIGVDGQDLFENDTDAKRPIQWAATRKFINRLLVLHNVNEDKLMGPHFVKADAAGNIPFTAFASKVLMYIWEDAARMCRRQLFGEGIGTYAELVGKWRNDGVKIFAKVMEETGVGRKDDECKKLYADMVNPDTNGAAAN